MALSVGDEVSQRNGVLMFGRVAIQSTEKPVGRPRPAGGTQEERASEALYECEVGDDGQRLRCSGYWHVRGLSEALARSEVWTASSNVRVGR